MKVLITSIVDLEKTSHNRLHQFVRHLSRNHTIAVLSINDWWKTAQADVSQYRQGVEDMLRGVIVRYFTARKVSPYLQEVFSVLTLNRLLKELDYDSFDVHLNYNTLISGYYVARKLRSAGINTVYDIADDLPQMIRNSPQIPAVLRPLGEWVGNAMVKKNIQFAKKVICATDSLRHSAHVPQAKFQLIPNGVDTELFQSYPSQEFRKKLGIESDFVIGYVGVLREWVDLRPVMRAVQQLSGRYPHIKIMIVGEEGGLKLAKDLAHRYTIADRVIFTGTVPYPQVPRYLSCMDVCVVPFKEMKLADDLAPLKLFEYMACGKPVISSRTMSVAQDKILYAFNDQEYADRIAELYESSELRAKLGVENRRFVESGYDWSYLGHQLETVLLEVAS